MLKREDLFYIAVLCISIGLRFLHFEPYMDNPHEWRQCDTAYYIWHFFAEDMNILTPEVCWNGPEGEIILEFPLPEYIAAFFFKIFGYHLWLGRLVFLGFYVLSVVYLYKVIYWVSQNKQWGYLSAIVYSLMPLGIYYSRVIHIDLSVMALALAAVYYWLKGTDTPAKEKRFWAIGTVLATLAAVIKVPYIFYMAIPVCWYMWYQKRSWSFIWRRAFPWSLVVVAVFTIWRLYVHEVNAMHPKWHFLPDYKDFSDLWFWFFGNWEQRMVWSNWVKIFSRLGNEVIQITGGILLLAGVGFLLRDRHPKHLFLWYWLIGLVLYVVIFFNLNIVHNYYQNPFMPLMAIIIAYGMHRLALSEPSITKQRLVLLVMVIVLAWNNLMYAESNYYRTNEARIHAGKLMRAHTERGDLLIVSNRNCGGPNPIYLYKARRQGWCVRPDDLNQPIVKKLKKLGADYLCVVKRQLPHDHWLQKTQPVYKKQLVNQSYLYIYDLGELSLKSNSVVE